MTLAAKYPFDSGRKHRKTKRLEGNQNCRRIGLEFCKQEMDEAGFVTDNDMDADTCQLKLAQISALLNENLKAGLERKAAKMLLRRRALTIVEKQKLKKVDIPKAEVIMAPVDHALTFEGFAKANAISVWDANAEKATVNNLETNIADVWWALAVYSFCRDSLQLDPVWIREFASSLFEADTILTVCGNKVLIHLRIEAQKEATKGKSLYNKRMSDKDGKATLVLSKDCFLSPETVFLIQKFKCAPASGLEVNPDKLVFMIQRLIGQTEHYCDQIKSTGDLAQAVGHHYILDTRSPISPVLQEISAGRVESVGLNPANAAVLSGQPNEVGSVGFFEDLGKFVRPVSGRHRGGKSAGQNLGKFYKDIVAATSVGHSSDDTLRSIETSLRDPKKTKEYSESQRLIIDWICSLTHPDKSRTVGKRGKYAALTVKSYARLFVSRWVQCIGDEDVRDFGFEDWLDAIEEMISLSEPELDDPGGLLPFLIQSFAGYVEKSEQANSYALPPFKVLRQLFPQGERRNHMVRARVVRADHVEKVFRYLTSNRIECGRQLALMTILAFRCGLRVFECVKLTHGDFELPFLTVRKSKFGILKSEASERTLDLSALLSPDGYALIARYLEENATGKPDHLVFSPLPGKMWAPVKVGQQISELLREVTGDDRVVFHSLRHSAANIFHAALEEDYALASKLSGFKKSKLKEIRAFIMLSETRVQEKYWHLARVMGHAHFSETLRRYLHFCDHILSNKVDATPSRHSLAQLAEWQGSKIEASDRMTWLENTRADSEQLFRDEKALMSSDFEPIAVREIKDDRFETLLKFLNWLERGRSFARGVEEFQLNEKEAQTCLKNALRIYFRAKSKGKYGRVFGPRPKPVTTLSGKRFMLTPYKMFGVETEFNASVIKALRKIGTLLEDGKIDLEEIREWSLVMTMRLTTAKEIVLEKPAEAIKVTTVLEHLLPRTGWDADIRHKSEYEEIARDLWDDLAIRKDYTDEGPAVRTPRKPGGIAHLLFIQDPHLPRVLAHTVAIAEMKDMDKAKNDAGEIDFDAAEVVFREIVQT